MAESEPIVVREQQVPPSIRRVRVPVKLNIYDMFWINEYTSALGIGIFHSGVEVHNREYAFGGHPMNFSGIYEIRPRNDRALGEGFHYRESITVGQTNLTAMEVEEVIRDLGHLFSGKSYHLMNKNCNHFANYLTNVLCGQSIPKWINRLANITSYVPGLQRCLPKEWLTPMALQQSSITQRSQRKETSSKQRSRRQQRDRLMP